MTTPDKKLLEFKDRITDLTGPRYDDYYLQKWLKARKFDVNKAEQMFRKSIYYRQAMGVDTLLQDYRPPEVLRKYLAGGFCGHDKEGSPVRIEMYGHLDFKGLMCSVRKSDLEKTKLWQCEWTVEDCRKQSEKLGKCVDGLTVIFDMEGVGRKMFWRPGMQMYLYLVKILEDNYPEMLKRLLVINAPKLFPLLYKLARPLVSDEMRDKIHILGGDYHHTLLKYIEDSQIPGFLGGTLCDPDGNPRCPTMVCWGGEVPHEYYLQNDQLSLNMTEVTIPRGEKFYVEHNVEQPGSALRWEFKTEDYNIGFGVFQKGEKGNIPIVPVTRVNSHVVAEDGSVLCENKGKYFICFDNSFSWIRSKKLMYVSEVISEDEEVAEEIRDHWESDDGDTVRI